MLNAARLRHSDWTRCMVALLAALCLIEPFLNVHFDAAGWEDESGLRLQQSGQALQPELRWLRADPADDTTQTLHQEATLFVPPSLDADSVLGQGLATAALIAVIILLSGWQAWRCNCSRHRDLARSQARTLRTPPDQAPPRWCGSPISQLSLAPNAPPSTPNPRSSVCC